MMQSGRFLASRLKFGQLMRLRYFQFCLNQVVLLVVVLLSFFSFCCIKIVFNWCCCMWLSAQYDDCI